MLRSGSRIIPKLRALLGRNSFQGKWITTPVVVVREFNLPRRNDPFSQMDTFFRDMEKKFWREIDSTFRWAPRFSRPGGLAVEEYTSTSSFGGPLDQSTAEKFKIVFSFTSAKPEDVKVTLKDRVLTVDGKVEEATENSKMYQSFSYQYTVPEGVELEALESLLSNDGVLTVEAPKSPESARTIPINRE